MVFKNRQEAGKLLASELSSYRSPQTVVFALPRGGVPVAYEISEVLHVPLDVVVARKIGAPGRSELGIGAIAEEDVEILNESFVHEFGISEDDLEPLIEREEKELKHRVSLYRNSHPLPDLKKKTVLLVDDGLATGVTAQAAIAALRKKHPKKIVFVSPVCQRETVADLQQIVDDVVCMTIPPEFYAVGEWYEKFDQVSDQEVIHLLQKSSSQNNMYVH